MLVDVVRTDEDVGRLLQELVTILEQTLTHRSVRGCRVLPQPGLAAVHRREGLLPPAG